MVGGSRQQQDGFSVSVFAVNQTTGALTAVSGSPFTTGSGPLSVAFSPSGTLLATANAYSSNVSVLRNSQDLWIGVSRDLLITTL